MNLLYSYTYIDTIVRIYIYIYIYIHNRIDRYRTISACHTPIPPTKSLGFGGFDSSKLLILKVGNSHVR